MNRKKALLAAGLITGAAMMTGCTANTMPAATATPQTAQQETAQPDASASPMETANAGGEETPGPIALRVDGEALKAGAMREGDRLLLPLVETAEALGWSARSESKEEENLTRRSVELTQGESRITVTWVVSDNTARQITWQKDGLLIPVDTELTTYADRVYVPAAFFETAMRATVEGGDGGVSVSTPAPQQTPETQNDQKPG